MAGKVQIGSILTRAAVQTGRTSRQHAGVTLLASAAEVSGGACAVERVAAGLDARGAVAARPALTRRPSLAELAVPAERASAPVLHARQVDARRSVETRCRRARVELGAVRSVESRPTCTDVQLRASRAGRRGTRPSITDTLGPWTTRTARVILVTPGSDVTTGT